MELILLAPSLDAKLIKCGTDNFRKNYFYKYLAQIGILTQEEIKSGTKARLTPHCTRHTFASIARKVGVEKDVLTRVIGHSDYKVTDEVYVAMDREMLSEELQKIAK
jgi:integrase